MINTLWMYPFFTYFHISNIKKADQHFTKRRYQALSIDNLDDPRQKNTRKTINAIDLSVDLISAIDRSTFSSIAY